MATTVGAEVTKEQITTFQRWMSRHFVSLVVIYRHLDDDGKEIGKPFIQASSGFVMSFGELWFLTTAGHVIQALNELTSHKKVKVLDSFLMDSLGSQAQHTDNIPLNYADCPRHGVYEDGLDFGFIGLDANTKRLLQANRIEHVAIQNWINVDVDRCFGFALLGVPAELVESEVQGGKLGYWIGTIMTSVKRLKRLPRGAKATKYKRFIGKIIKPNELKTMEGVSGGPIIGFYKDGENTRYWIVAVQSHCIGKKYVFGCPTKTFGNFMLAEMKALIESGQVMPEVMGPIAAGSSSSDQAESTAH